jgi:polysaccharide export outer membrane protein
MTSQKRLRLHRFLLLAAVLFVSACGLQPFGNPTAQQPTVPYLGPAADTSAEYEYGLQPGDVIQVSVWREPELDRVVRVRPDGGISFPLLGDIQAEGKSIDDLNYEIAEGLSAYIPNPEVTVSLQESEGNSIYIIGRVNNPGAFLARRPVDVMQALSLAGGLTPFANERKIRILRQEGNRQRSIPFDYSEVLKGNRLEQNITLRAGDTLVVP